jgi:hypothetical protein
MQGAFPMTGSNLFARLCSRNPSLRGCDVNIRMDAIVYGRYALKISF